MDNNFDHFLFLEECAAGGETGIKKWNEWRANNKGIQPYFSENNKYLANAKLTGIDLSGAIFSFASMLSGVQLDGANLEDSTIQGAIAIGANFSGANLRNARLNGTRFDGSNFADADLTATDFSEARLTGVKFIGAIFFGNNFENTNLTRADFSNTNLNGINLRQATLVEANFTNAIISDCNVYGISAWNIKTNGAIQKDLIITNYDESIITADSIEVAQLIHLLLNNPKIRDVIDTVAKKAVLILGRFSDERKAVLYEIKEELRKMDYLPILFDFEKPNSQNLTETVVTLANLSRFVIADITEPSSVIHELSTLSNNLYNKPIQPIFQPSDKGTHVYSMFEDFTNRFLPLYNYENKQNLINSLQDKVINPAENSITIKLKSFQRAS